MNGKTPKQLSKMFKIDVTHVYLMHKYFKRFIAEQVSDKVPKAPTIKLEDDP